MQKYSIEENDNKKPVNIFTDATPEEEALARTMSKSSHSVITSQLTDFTLALIKPDAVKAGFVKDIITDLNDNG